MTFVYPLLLGGLLLAGLPVLLHFLVRKKPRTLVFPAFLFLMQKKRSNTRSLRLRHFLLLLLRIALIVLVCFALARPRLLHESIGLSRERPVAMVLIIDNTQSMEYRSNELSRLDLAKRRCLELLDQLPDECRILVLDAADPASFAREDWHRSLEKVRQRVQSLTIRPESTPVTKALEEAHRRFELLDDPDAQRMPRFICVFSDRTKPSWDASVNASRESNVQVLYFDVGIDEPVDLGIVNAELAGQRSSYLAGEKIRLNATVKAIGKEGKNTVIVKLGDERPIEQAFNVEAGHEQILALEIDTVKLKPGLHQAEVALATANDALPHNNQRFITFRILEKPRVLVLSDEPGATKKFAFALNLLHYAVDARKAGESIDLGVYDAVFLVSVAAPTEKLWRDLAKFIKDGRSICVIPPGEELERPAYNSVAAQLVMPGLIAVAVESTGSRWNDGNVPDWGHPFLAPYRGWFVDGSHDLIRNPRSATRYWEVQPQTGMKVIVNYDLKPHPAVLERPASKQSGKVLLLTTPMDERRDAWNNYDQKLNSFYLALTYLCTRHLCAPPESLTFNFQFGMQPPSYGPAGQLFPKYVLTSGEFSEDIGFDEKGLWTAERLPRAGNYTVWGTKPDEQARTPLHRFSINVSEMESDLRRVDLDEIETVLGKNSVVPQDRRRSIVNTLNWDEPLELFPWLMIALLFLLATENLLANKFYRRTEPEA